MHTVNENTETKLQKTLDIKMTRPKNFFVSDKPFVKKVDGNYQTKSLHNCLQYDSKNVKSLPFISSCYQHELTGFEKFKAIVGQISLELVSQIKTGLAWKRIK